jgi:hypothetical protein
MVTSYVAQMPVQTQSAMVWGLALRDQLLSSTESSFFLLKYSADIVFLAAAAAAAWSLWRSAKAGTERGADALYAAGLAVTVIFFLLSAKVMAYYYAILIPFLVLLLVPRGRLGLLTACLAALSWIMLSPYYASWANPDHLWLYALLGTINSLFFLWLLWRVLGLASPGAVGVAPAGATFGGVSPGTAAVVVCALGVAVIVPGLFQPLHAVAWVPGRHDLSELAAAAVLLGVALVALGAAVAAIRRAVGGGRVRWAYLAVALYYPLAFMQFYVTQESTRILERLWK